MDKILVIEDDINVRDNILDLLAGEGYKLLSAENGRIGWQLAQVEMPDLIICDVTMPELDGYGVLKLLRQNPTTATTPFMFLTAKSDKTDFRQGMEMGADDYLIKPFTRGELLAAIACRLAKQNTIHQETQKKLDNLRNSIALSLPHEMRTPLNGILGFSQILMDESDYLDAHSVREMAESIYFSGERLLRLIQNFLLYAELEIVSTNPQQLQALQSKTTKFPSLSLLNIITEKAQEVGRAGDLQIDLYPCCVKISAEKIAKIVEELIDNALKFSPAGTLIQVKSKVINNMLVLSFMDLGRGMTVAQIAELGAYRQFERKLYEQQGSGLGLTIVKRLVQLHGGQLKIHSQPHQLTLVEVILPCREEEHYHQKALLVEQTTHNTEDCKSKMMVSD
ncbi:hybrid sensor histidine kinase/response regulator [Nostoc sp. CMAA1605]|uniref:hybrid sensor histidine kinase/response regulator n=1 Tax=Nostoc sp. CMAA1605 TaxID=2055159 RepID=UPI001F453378|nr:response regulator [Nostoc sp. CMAA1605]MCF4967989.1 hybrid sensor histidine kinase/response regulator [Nostoc sp. CMAA1605]